MFWRNFAAIAAMVPFVLATGNARSALPAPCWQAGELPAARLHEFKTMLLVGALRCRELAPDALEGYNQFVNQKREMIVSSIHVVKARFIRDGGMTAGADAFTDYETRLGNRYSSMGHDAAFCAKIATYARLAASASSDDIGVLWGAVAPAQSTDPCAVEASPAGESMAIAAIRPAVAPDPLPIATAPAGSADAAAVAPIAASASPAAGASADVATAAVPAVAPDQPKVVTPSAPSAAQSLAEAAKALAAAAAALEAQNPHLATVSKPD